MKQISLCLFLSLPTQYTKIPTINILEIIYFYMQNCKEHTNIECINGIKEADLQRTMKISPCCQSMCALNLPSISYQGILFALRVRSLESFNNLSCLHNV